MTTLEASKPKLSGRHVLMALLAFFGVVASVNAYFIFAAVSTHSGEVESTPYDIGLNYNSRIAADARQAALGWRADIDLARNGVVTVSMLDKADVPLRGLKVRASISRPSTGSFDHDGLLTEQSDGSYVLRVDALESGAWVVAVEARSGTAAEPEFRSKRRQWLKP